TARELDRSGHSDLGSRRRQPRSPGARAVAPARRARHPATRPGQLGADRAADGAVHQRFHERARQRPVVRLLPRRPVAAVPAVGGRPLMGTHRWVRIATATVGVAVLAAVVGIVVWGDQVPTQYLTADFTSAVGVHDGSDVRVLGVKIGRVVSVRPEGQTVRVEMRYDSRYPIPADVRAVIVPPSVVSDRYVQL